MSGALPLSCPEEGNCHTPPPGPVRSTLPGQGSYGPGCGAKRPAGWWSTHDGCLPLVYHRCDRRECPRCGGKHLASSCDLKLTHSGGNWAHEEAIIVAAKLQGYADSIRTHVLRQVVVSPPLVRYAESDDHTKIVARVRRAAAKALRELGWRGQSWASIIVHLYRGCEADGYSRWGPHAHLISSGVDVRKVAEYASRTGVIVKQPTDREGRFASYWGRRLVRHLVYELGHSAVIANAHSVSYVGRALVAFKVLEPLKIEVDRPPPKCPHGHAMNPLGRGGRPKYDAETREWTFKAETGGEYRFLDRAPTQGGPLLERLTEGGRLVAVSIRPYLSPNLEPPPYIGTRKRREVET